MKRRLNTAEGERHCDERGISTLVSHVLALAIVSILIVGLFVSANSYLRNQKEIVVKDGLDTVGNRLAAEVSQVDRLSNRSANVTLWATHQEQIAGAPYNAKVAHGAECDTGLVTSQNCVIVASGRFGIKRRIPIHNDTAIEINQTEPGRFQITALGRGRRSRRTTTDPTQSLVESNMRFGIGESVRRDSVGESSNLQNRKPTNLSIRLDTSSSKAYPRAKQSLSFVVEAEDIDGTIKNYEVNFDSKRSNSFEWDASVNTDELKLTRTFSTSNPGVDPPGYDSAGTYNITLRVTDEDGETREYRRWINISGLRRIQFTQSPGTARGKDLTFEFTNAHGKEIKIQGLYLDPRDDDVDTLNAGTGDAEDDTSPWELGFDTDGNTNWNLTFQSGDDQEASGPGLIDTNVAIRETIADSGVFTYPPPTSYSGGYERNAFPKIGAGQTARIRFRGLRPSGSPSYNLTITYRLDGKLVRSQFTKTVGNQGPTAAFTINDSSPFTGENVTFDAAPSSDPDGSITSYEWDLDGDGTFEKSGMSVTKSYSSDGTRTVTLRVTDNGGRTDTETRSVVVDDSTASVVNLQSSTATYSCDRVRDRVRDCVIVTLYNDDGEIAEIDEVGVEVATSSPASQISDGYNIAIASDFSVITGTLTGVESYTPTYALGSGPVSLENEIDSYDTGGIYLYQFQDPSGNPVDVSNEEIELTVVFADGSQKTYRFNP